MKTENQIRQKLKQVLFRNLQKRLRANFKQKPETCVSNRAPHLAGQNPLKGCPRVCTHPDRAGQVCDEQHGGHDQAKGCPLWAAHRTKTQVESGFAEGYRDMVTRAKRGERHPEFPIASAFMWVLGDEPESPAGEAPTAPEPEVVAEPEETEDEDEEDEPSQMIPRDRFIWSPPTWWGHPVWPWNWSW